MINKEKIKLAKQQRRKARVRAKISGTAKIPRLSVFRSLNNTYVQLVDDERGKTLVSANSKETQKTKKQENKKTLKENKEVTKKVNEAFEVGKLIADKAQAKKIKQCVFDKGSYKYHGRVKAVAEGAREGGLIF